MGEGAVSTDGAGIGLRRVAAVPAVLAVLLVVGLLPPPAAGADSSPAWSQLHGDGGNTLQAPAAGPSTPGVRWVRDFEEPTPAERAFAPEGYELAHRGGDGLAPIAADGVLMLFARNVAQGRAGVDLIGIDAAAGEVRWEIEYAGIDATSHIIGAPVGATTSASDCMPAVDSQGRVWVHHSRPGSESP